MVSDQVSSISAVSPLCTSKGTSTTTFLLESHDINTGNTLGAGALSLPLAFSYSGYGIGLSLLLLASITCYFTIGLLVDARNVTGCRSLEHLMVVTWGRRWAMFVEGNILVLCFGTSVAYIVAVGDLATPLLQLTPISAYIHRDLVMIVMTIIIIGPLCCLRDFSSLRFTSALGVSSVFFLASINTFNSVDDLESKGFSHSWSEAMVISSDPMMILKSIPIIMFAFTCQINVMYVH